MYFNYVRLLRFDEAPDYMYLRQLFKILWRTLNYKVSRLGCAPPLTPASCLQPEDSQFDWVPLLAQQAQQQQHSKTGTTAGNKR